VYSSKKRKEEVFESVKSDTKLGREKVELNFDEGVPKTANTVGRAM
jgi:hypothetical protein